MLSHNSTFSLLVSLTHSFTHSLPHSLTLTKTPGTQEGFRRRRKREFILDTHEPDIECFEELPKECGGRGRCVGDTRECIQIRAMQVLHTDVVFLKNKFDGECTPANGGTSSCAAFNDASLRDWLPEELVDNMQCACDALPDTEPTRCVRQFVASRLNDNGRYNDKAALQNAKSEWLSRRGQIDEYWSLLPAPKDAAKLEALHRINDEAYWAQQLTLMDRVTGDWVDAYQQCCCATSPTWFAAWLASVRVGKSARPNWCEFVSKQQEEFAPCQDRRRLLDRDQLVDELFFVVANVDYLCEEGGTSLPGLECGGIDWQPSVDGHHYFFEKMNNRKRDFLNAGALGDASLCLSTGQLGPVGPPMPLVLFDWGYSVPV